MGLKVGDIIQDKYRIVRLLGQGGMGAVFEGENLLIHRRVAIKVLHGNVATQQGVVERFEREAQAAGRIGNDHILEVLDMGKLPDGDRFMVMEFLDGETLEQRLKRVGRLDERQLYPIARQLLSGLMAAHAAGIIHRDLKPDNVFVMREKAGQPDFVKIIDFGISKFTSTGPEMKMTATGAVMGTPYFMSPEQAKGSRDSDARSDLYAVGVILFKALTGRVPFDAPNFNELLFKIVLSPTPRVSSVLSEVDPVFDDIVLGCMARDPAQRFQTTRDLIAALDNWYAHGTALPGATPFLYQAGVATELPDPYSQQRDSQAPRDPQARGERISGVPGLPSRTPSIPGRLSDSQNRQPRSQSPRSFGNAPTSAPPPYGSGLQTAEYPNYAGTGGTWSNTGYATESKRNHQALLVAGASAAVAALLGLGYVVFGTQRQPATPLPPAVVVGGQNVTPPRPPAPLPPPVQPQPAVIGVTDPAGQPGVGQPVTLPQPGLAPQPAQPLAAQPLTLPVAAATSAAPNSPHPTTRSETPRSRPRASRPVVTVNQHMRTPEPAVVIPAEPEPPPPPRPKPPQDEFGY